MLETRKLLILVAVVGTTLLGSLRAQREAQQHWAYAPLRRPGDAAPAAIDRLLGARLRELGLAPAGEADRATLVRRLYLDLLGLPPSPEEVDAQAASDAPDWYPTLVDTLLASPQHAEHLARQWLDIVRYADTDGFEMNTPRPNAYPYRDWVIGAFASDLGYDEFVFAQLAGDTIGADAATGFLVAGPSDGVKSPDPRLTAEQRANEIAGMVDATASAFLGTTVACARCHDHKFDPVTQRDFYAMAAVFAGVQHGERRLHADDEERRLARRDAIRAELAARPDAPLQPTLCVDAFEPRYAQAVRFTIDATADGAEPCIDELEVFGPDDPSADLALASSGAIATASSVLPGYSIHQIAHLNDGLVGNPHSWISNERGAGQVEIRFAAPARIDRVVWSRDRLAAFTDRLASRYRIAVEDPAGDWSEVANGDRRMPPDGTTGDHAESETAALVAELATLSRETVGYVGAFTAPPPMHVLYRGDPTQPRDPVAPGAVAAFGPLVVADDDPEPQRRAALARWIVGPARALTARVLVNRLWQGHFGTGLVTTPSDFGRNGAAPQHTELLDALACELVEHGWSIRHVERTIVTSAAYRRASAVRDAKAEALDAGSRTLWRYPSRRVAAEVIRDSMLAVSGQLDPRMGGPGFDLFEPNDNYVRVYEPKRSFGPAEFRRMVYARVVRMEKDATFGAFDCPDAGQPMPRRSRSTTALQALALLNSPFVLQQAEALAGRIAAEVGDERGAQVRRAFALVLQRAPFEDERFASEALCRDHGLGALCRALFNTTEFLFVP